ncbi:ThiF family adenylyltransferase [Arthrobacter sp. SA17]
MPHHLNPFSKEVCLLGTPSEEWGTNGSLAQLLRDQLPEAIRAGLSDDHEGAEWNEKPQAEPYGAYYTTYASAAMVLVDGSWSIPEDAVQGPIEIRLAGPLPGPDVTAARTLGSVVAVGSDTGQTYATLDKQLQDLLEGQLVHGRWSRLAEPVKVDDAQAIWEAGQNADRSSTREESYLGRRIQVRAVLFPEETGPRKVSDGWAFVLRVRGTQRHNNKANRRGGARSLSVYGGADQYHLLRTGRAGRSDLRARIPELLPLATKKVAIVGAGAIGSAVAVHLGRAGLGHLYVIDPDVLEPGNLVRHSASFDGVGLLKAAAVGRLVRSVAPYTQVMFNPAYLGEPARKENRILFA